MCGGVDGCDICKGAGSFEIRRCPVVLASGRDTQIVRRFFSLWRMGGKGLWPDGGPALEQATALVAAFSIMENATQEGERRDMDNEMSRARSKNGVQ